ERREERGTNHGRTQGSQQMNALLVHGGKITAKVTKDGNPCLGAKTARNLLAQFHHAQIGLGLIIVKRHGKIIHEPQDQASTQALMESSKVVISLAHGCPNCSKIKVSSRR